jgi:hypothetical protein
MTAALAALLAGCGGSSQENGSGGTASAADVEASVKAQLEQGGGGGVVDHGNGPPKVVTCRKVGGEWRCTVKYGKGRDMLCLVPAEDAGRKVPFGQPTCRGIDY